MTAIVERRDCPALFRSGRGRRAPAYPFTQIFAFDFLFVGAYPGVEYDKDPEPEAARKALLRDGGNWIEPVGDLHFPGWAQDLGFSAFGGPFIRSRAGGLWQGAERGLGVLQEVGPAGVERRSGKSDQDVLETQSKRIGNPTEKTAKDDPRKIVASTLDYVLNDAKRMNDPQHRQWGLPVSSAPVESLIPQFNQHLQHLKGRRNFGSQAGLRPFFKAGRLTWVKINAPQNSGKIANRSEEPSVRIACGLILTPLHESVATVMHPITLFQLDGRFILFYNSSFTHLPVPL